MATTRAAPLYIELPASVVLEITYTEPGLQGDRSTGGTKPATVETGARDPGAAVRRPPARRSRSTPATAATSAAVKADLMPARTQGAQARARRPLRGRRAGRRRRPAP